MCPKAGALLVVEGSRNPFLLLMKEPSALREPFPLNMRVCGNLVEIFIVSRREPLLRVEIASDKPTSHY